MASELELHDGDRFSATAADDRSVLQFNRSSALKYVITDS